MNKVAEYCAGRCGGCGVAEVTISGIHEDFGAGGLLNVSKDLFQSTGAAE